MATIKVTLTELEKPGQGQAWIASWPLMLNGDVGETVDLANYADRSIQVEGTFGAGGSCAIEGTNDTANFRTLNDPQGTALAITAAGIKSVTEVSRQMRPHVTAGDGTTSLTVTAFLRRTKQP